MRSFMMAFAAATLVLVGINPALARCDSSDQRIQVGSVTGDAEKDTFGLDCAGRDIEHTGSVALAARGKMGQIGLRMGDPEKDTWGYATLIDL